jgi:hypothetical protein
LPQKIYIPAEVAQSIREHIGAALDRCQEGFWSGNEDEDTLTGHLGFALKTGVHTVNVAEGEIRGPWKWSIDYSKFRGRGRNAPEKHIGADGIVELRLSRGLRMEVKSLLFQAKTDWQTSQELVSQAMLLSTWREAAIVVNYTPSGLYAYPIDSVLESRGVRSKARGGTSLNEALGDYFLQCKIGDTNLAYDARRRRLAWRSQTGEMVATQFSVPQRLRFNVRAPTLRRELLIDTMLPSTSIHRHRMAASPEEMLAPLLTAEQPSVKSRRKALSLAYHPDSYMTLPQQYLDLATMRMQEVNSAYDEIGKQSKGTRRR